MPYSFVAQRAGGDNTTGNSALTVTGATANNVLICAIFNNQAASPIVDETGNWTELAQGGPGNGRTGLWARVATGDSNDDTNFSPAGRWVSAVYEYSGLDNSVLLSGNGSTANEWADGGVGISNEHTPGDTDPVAIFTSLEVTGVGRWATQDSDFAISDGYTKRIGHYPGFDTGAWGIMIADKGAATINSQPYTWTGNSGTATNVTIADAALKEISGGVGASLSGVLAGLSSVVAGLFAVAAMAGSLDGASTVTGSLQPSNYVSGTLAGSSTITADLEPASTGASLDGTLPGTSTITGDLDAYPSADIAGTLPGSSSITGSIVVGNGLFGSLAGTSAAGGDLEIFPVIGLAGSMEGTSAITGNLSGTAALAGTLDGQAYVFGTLASNRPPRIPIAMNLEPFFNNNEFSHDALHNGATLFKVIVTDWYDPVIGGTVGMGTTDPMLIAQHDDIPDVADGDTISIDGYSYTVREVRPDNTGIVRLKCEVSS
jgi:hypothetical protein